tara:strand:- start:467 stop:949 length:483 start_codon:yes stop_codon:yes gene_type:complete
VNSSKVGTEVDVNRYMDAWNAYLRDEHPASKVIDRTWKENRIHDVFDFVDVPEKWIYGSSTKDRPIKDFLEGITKYQFPSTEKKYCTVALVVFPLEFNKYEEEAQCRFVFFNPKTLNIIWTPIAKGKTGYCGMTAHWANGVYDALMNMTRFVRRANGDAY